VGEYLRTNPIPADKSLAQLAEQLGSVARDFGTVVHGWMEDDDVRIGNIKKEFLFRFPNMVECFQECSFYDERGFGGTIDLRIMDNDGTVHIIDYKTTKNIDAAKSTDYERQLCFYAMHHTATKINPNLKCWILWIEADDKKGAVTGKWRLDKVEWEKQLRWCELALELYKEGNKLNG
jgi:hypothetical protein